MFVLYLSVVSVILLVLLGMAFWCLFQFFRIDFDEEPAPISDGSNVILDNASELLLESGCRRNGRSNDDDQEAPSVVVGSEPNNYYTKPPGVLYAQTLAPLSQEWLAAAEMTEAAPPPSYESVVLDKKKTNAR